MPTMPRNPIAERGPRGDIELVDDGGLQTVGLRFRNVTIPRNATILSAYVQFQVDETNSAACNLVVRGELAPNSLVFTTATGNVSGRNRTVASAAWSPAGWTSVGLADTAQRTTDLSSIVSEIVHQGTWNSGNALSLIVTGTGRRTASRRRNEHGRAAPPRRVRALISLTGVGARTDAATTSSG